uniref:Receptor-like serine/threonine-protein kinase n=1 Tax=Oryza barthii TaxID=65489 RepID=A0A0D3GS79_9ORYZ
MAMAAASAMRPLAPLFLFFFFSLAASASDNILANSSLADGQKLVSAGGVFELGFFTPPGSTTAARFLGIWYRDIDPPTVVWVANRDAPVSGTAGSLAVVVNGGGGGGGGRLVLGDGSGRVVWSSAPSNVTASDPVAARLLDNGNFVLAGGGGAGDVIWQSFDYPSDTLLPGMKFGWDLTTGLDRYLTTWRSAGDPSPGDYTFKIDPRGAPEGFIWYNGTSPVYRNGPWDGLQFSGEPEMEPNNTSFRFENWELRDSSAGCARRTRLNCTGDGFLPLRGVKLPDTTNATVDAAIAVDQCRARCLANCSCVAYAASDVRGGGSGCIMWSSPLVDIRKFSYGGEDLFMRLAASDLPTNGDDSSRKNTVLAVVLSLSGVVLLALAAFFVWDKLFRNKVANPVRFQSPQRFTSFDSSIPLNQVQDRKMEDETRHSNELNVTLFDFNTIAFSTDNFANLAKLGEGGFGPVYKGELDGGQTVAVKRLSKFSTQGLDEFKNEVMLIARLQHVNLVRLLGCCIHGEERMLVYEYMENKSLDNFIFDKARSAQLNWSKRFNIILGIARGLLYLHQDSRFKIIHRDLKAGNILLDGDMNPKISDFGVARIFGDDTDSHTRKVVGTYGYMSPEYAMDGVFSVKSDVFSFGVLVLELVSGRKNRGMYSSGEQTSLLSHAWRLWREGNALAPHMAAVFMMLGNLSAVVPQPRHPGFCSDRGGGGGSTDGEWSSTCTVNDVTVTIVEGR